MTVLTKAKDLCEAIAQSDEFQELIRTETILINDIDAQDLIERFNKLQTELENLFRQGKKATAQQFRELRVLEEELNKDLSAGPYFKAQHKFTDLLSQINKMINDTIQLKNNIGTGHCICGKHTSFGS
ncbi:YlbF family regulator [Desulfosporosinus sp. SYSU MS00001]|uniref:YlbF family regulator n=1 Tax=Desulfosporosinus sp. SYSU MS00001 TaxID=3416284 RepID=UPI003CEFFBF5